jgi:hypothetical protein
MTVPASLENALGDDVGRVWCPHMAMLLASPQELHPALAAFYSLGASRNGWMLHRSLPGEGDADRAGLTAAGLDIAALEADRRFTLTEVPVTEPPGEWAQPWVPLIEDALRDGYEAVWWSRFPVGPSEEHYQQALEYDRYWETCFHERKAVSLCVYIVEGVTDPTRERRVRDLSEIHDATLVVPPDHRVEAHPRRAENA